MTRESLRAGVARAVLTGLGAGGWRRAPRWTPIESCSWGTARARSPLPGIAGLPPAEREALDKRFAPGVLERISGWVLERS